MKLLNRMVIDFGIPCPCGVYSIESTLIYNNKDMEHGAKAMRVRCPLCDAQYDVGVYDRGGEIVFCVISSHDKTKEATYLPTKEKEEPCPAKDSSAPKQP